MFEDLFSRPSAVQRHRNAPLTAERVAYIQRRAEEGASLGLLRLCAHYTRWIAHRLEKRPAHHLFHPEDLNRLADSWARRPARTRRAVPVPSPKESFRAVARGFLDSLDLLAPVPAAPPVPHEAQLLEFIEHLREHRGLSTETCRSRRSRIRRFLVYLAGEGLRLEDVRPIHLDAYFGHLGASLSRVSLRSVAVALRAWLRHCEAHKWVRQGLAKAIFVPRVYTHEGIPLGPTWDQVARAIAACGGDRPCDLRARAILLLLALYGVRSGEVCRLRLDDVDWNSECIRFSRSKGGRQDTFPLEAGVGDAIARYLRHARPRSPMRTLFLTLQSPLRPLSRGCLYSIVAPRLNAAGVSGKGRGPHAIRHTCARHLVEAGLSLKEIGDHLGHRSPEATRIYAKVDLAALRLVALEDLGGLS